MQGEFDKMTLVDFSGKEVQQINCSGRTSVEINTTGVAPGIYFLYSVSASGKTTCVKLVKSDY